MKIILAALIILSSCSTPNVSQTDAAKDYRLDAGIDVNGVKGTGTLVIPRSTEYKVSVTFPSNPEIATLSTCHREGKLSVNGNVGTAVYKPTEVEAGYCPVIISGFSQKFRYSAALVDFRDHELLANLSCNGLTTAEIGTSICQSRQGMVQGLRFKSAAKTAKPSPGCSAATSADGLYFEIVLSKGRCVYVFMSDGEMHRLSTYGFDEVQLGR
jgi:hypothetical protein